ncbi:MULTISPECIES: LysR family transcriptional regulator [Microvirgula]|uniref:LysR family transcriptional regulator n=1 Tax=Microvirgula aerodenitrificans TaxID=57480 RepID=A0A2S0PCQ5_9NEIS|nr:MULTISPECIES: LysR substrate-binding domain-containing protein [Microvirgula]AVY95113.1 LysR family transcriptional regulator [Microvirgula aerodenitrificans]RAS16017.1 LysR family transcriptional regulator [Microvirgula sp. AG722]
MELRQYRYFIAVAEQLHFARAAELLGITPPSLTRQIQDMERELGVSLFHRTKRSVALSAAGEVLLTEARLALLQCDRAEERVRRAGRGESGRIEIGYVASAAYCSVLQTYLARFRLDMPGVELRLHELSMERIPTMLDDGGLDLAFVRPPLDFPDGIDTVTVHRDHFVVVLPDAHPLAKLASIPAARLRHDTFILPEQDYGTHEVSRRGDFMPRLGPRAGGLVAVVTQVSLGVGVAIVPRVLAECLRMPKVVYRELNGEPIPSELALAYRRHEKAPAAMALIRHIRRSVHQ